MPVNKDNVLKAIEQHRELLEYVLDEVLVKLQSLWPQVYTPNIFVNHVNFGVDEITLEYYNGQDKENLHSNTLFNSFRQRVRDTSKRRYCRTQQNSRMAKSAQRKRSGRSTVREAKR